MAKTKAPVQRQASLSYEPMRAAIPKVDRRIAEITSLMGVKIGEVDDTRAVSLASKIDALLVEIFGADTVEYERYSLNSRIIPGILYTGMDIPAATLRGLEHAKAQLEVIRALFEEALEGAGGATGSGAHSVGEGGMTKFALAGLGQSQAGKALNAYKELELHPAIESAAGNLFRDGHYSNAVEDAVKALNSLVKSKSGVADKDGTALMENVFSVRNPVLKFNDLQDDSDRDEQRGMMLLFSGAVMGLRNPRAHKLIKDDPERALEFIAFVSLLAKLADQAKKC